MTYDDIIATVKNYADRYDTEANTFLPNAVPLVEGRINNVLTSRLSWVDAIIPIVSLAIDFSFPADLLFLKQVKLVTTDGVECIFDYVDEKYFNSVLAAGASKPYYTITNAQFRVAWSFKNNSTESLHIRYEQKVPPLSPGLDNWLSKACPQIYVFGLLVELYAFVKDSEAASQWEKRFVDELNAINDTDYKTQWSGETPLQQRLG